MGEIATGNKRIEVADALRGFAVATIILLHCLEHFNFYHFPDPATQPALLNFTDTAIFNGMFFMVGGKAYAIFALLFGLSFQIMYTNQLRKGHDFRLRFCWRMVLLFLIGNLNACFFTGEVLVLYSLVGFVLPLVCRLSNRTVLIIASVCMLQPVEWMKLIYGVLNPDYIPVSPDAPYWPVTYQAQDTAGFWEMVKVNLWEGQLASIFWAWNNGRMFQTASLFMIGMVIGRKNLFEHTPGNMRIWGITISCALIAFFPLYGLSNMYSSFIGSKAILAPLSLITTSLHKFCFMTILVVAVLFAFYCTTGMRKILAQLKPYGRMSLTNYLTQSMLGSFLFYNWGLHLNTGHTLDIFIGAGILLIQIIFCHYWLKKYSHGPFEMVWRKLTYIGQK